MPGSLQADSVGPVDVAVIVFDNSEFNGDVAPALLELADAGIVRIIDASFVSKDLDGAITAIEVEDAEIAAAFERVTGDSFDLLSDEDLDAIATDLEPGASALVIVWENSWAGRFAGAVRASGGRMLAFERIPHTTVLDAIAALELD